MSPPDTATLVEDLLAMLAEVPDQIWTLADLAEQWRLAAQIENRGMASASGTAIQVTDAAYKRFCDALLSMPERHMGTAVNVLRVIGKRVQREVESKHQREEAEHAGTDRPG